MVRTWKKFRAVPSSFRRNSESMNRITLYARDLILEELAGVTGKPRYPSSSFYDILNNLGITPSRSGYTQFQRKHILGFAKWRQMGRPIETYQEKFTEEVKRNAEQTRDQARASQGQRQCHHDEAQQSYS